jgi:hypothetical protein
MIYVVSLLFRFEGTVPSSLKTVISQFIGASIYGLVLPQSLELLLPSSRIFARAPATTIMPWLAVKRLYDDKKDRYSIRHREVVFLRLYLLLILVVFMLLAVIGIRENV